MIPELMNKAISVPLAFASLPFPLEPALCFSQCSLFSKHVHVSVDAQMLLLFSPWVREAAWPLTLPDIARGSGLRASGPPQVPFHTAEVSGLQLLREVICSQQHVWEDPSPRVKNQS